MIVTFIKLSAIDPVVGCCEDCDSNDNKWFLMSSLRHIVRLKIMLNLDSLLIINFTIYWFYLFRQGPFVKVLFWNALCRLFALAKMIMATAHLSFTFLTSSSIIPKTKLPLFSAPLTVRLYRWKSSLISPLDFRSIGSYFFPSFSQHMVLTFETL